MMKLEIPTFNEVVERNTNGIQFGIFDSADNVKWAVRDHHSRWVFEERCNLKGRYPYAIKFRRNNSGEWGTRDGDCVYKVNSDGTIDLL